MDFSDGYLIDVREEDEWQEGHLPGAIHHPLSLIQKGHLPQGLSKEKTLYLHCARGRRALLAKEILDKEYPHVIALTQSFDELSK